MLLGIINFSAKFVPIFSHVHPLHRVLQLKVAWHWSATLQAAFEEVKMLLAAAPVLAQYVMDAPLQLESDALPYGVGAVLSHVNQNGRIKHVA